MDYGTDVGDNTNVCVRNLQVPKWDSTKIIVKQ